MNKEFKRKLKLLVYTVIAALLGMTYDGQVQRAVLSFVD